MEILYMMFRVEKYLENHEYGNRTYEFQIFDLDGGYMEDRSNLCVSLPGQL